MDKIFWISSVLLIVTTSAFSQEKNTEVDKIFSAIKPDDPGCSVAFSQNGKLAISRSYGMADLEREVAITTKTVFDAGSVRKQFGFAIGSRFSTSPAAIRTR